jgi:hypothetical protein
MATHLGAKVNPARLLGELIGGVVRAGIYTAYMLLSKRVAATFVVRYVDRSRRVGARPRLFEAQLLARLYLAVLSL